MRLLASRPNVSNTRLKVANVDKMYVSSFTTKNQGKCRKRTRHLNITILQIHAVIPNWVVYLRDVELPEQTVVLVNVRQSFLKKSAKRSLESASRTQIHENFGKNHQHSGTSGTSSGSYPGGPKHHRNSNTPHFFGQRPKQQAGGQKMVPEKQRGNGPKQCTEFAERTWRTKLHSSIQRCNGEQHQPSPAILTRKSLLLILVHQCI